MYKTGIRFAATLLLTILLVAFVIVPAVNAATIPFTVYGTVSGNSGGSVTVSIASLGMSTSTSGYYQMSGNSFVPGNTYTVTASASGYDTASAQFTIPVENGSKQQIDLHMTKTATATPNPATATPNPVTATPNPVTATPNPGTPTPTSQSSNGDPASYSIGLVVVNETSTPSPTVEPSITPSPTAEPTVTPTPTSVPLPITTAQTSPDWTCLLFLLGLLIAFIIGYLAGRKHEQMKQGKKEQPKQP